MESESCGYTWKPNVRAKPSLLTAWRSISRSEISSCRKWKYPIWVMDYSFHEAGKVRVGSWAKPWRQRHARTAHLYPPETVFWEDASGLENSVSHNAYVLFLGGEACGLADLIDHGARYAKFLDPEGLLGAKMEQMARIGHKEGDSGFWKAQAEFCSLVDLLIHSEAGEGEIRLIRNATPVPDSSELIVAANAYMDKNLAGRVALSAIAENLHVSMSTLSHRYQQETGESPMGHLLRMRINLSKTLIMKGQSLKSVAESVGFSDAFHLSKTFKRIEGLSPKAYLQYLRQANRRRV